MLLEKADQWFMNIKEKKCALFLYIANEWPVEKIATDFMGRLAKSRILLKTSPLKD